MYTVYVSGKISSVDRTSSNRQICISVFLVQVSRQTSMEGDIVRITPATQQYLMLVAEMNCLRTEKEFWENSTLERSGIGSIQAGLAFWKDWQKLCGLIIN